MAPALTMGLWGIPGETQTRVLSVTHGSSLNIVPNPKLSGAGSCSYLDGRKGKERKKGGGGVRG